MLKRYSQILISCLLASLLVACGASPATTEEAPQQEQMQEADGTLDNSTEVGEADHVLSSFGHMSFDNHDEIFELVSEVGELQNLVNASALPDASLEPYCVVLPKEGSPEEEGYAIVMRTQEGTEITSELCETILTNWLGRDTHVNVSLDDGSIFQYTYDVSDNLTSMVVLDELDGTLWVTAITAPQSQTCFPLFSVADDFTLDTLIEPALTIQTQRIGNEQLGFVSIPDNWGSFTDVDNPEIYQYADPSAANIITLDVYTAEELGLLDDPDYALMLAYSFIQRYEDSEDVTEYESYTDTVAGYDAYLIISHWSDGTDMYTYIVNDAEAQRAHYIAVEGDPQTAFDVAMVVRDSFSLSE